MQQSAALPRKALERLKLKIKVDEDDVVVYDVWLIRRCSGLVLLMATDRIT